MNSVEASLKRLGTDYIDLYQIHRFDPLTNIEDTLRALDDLVRAGKVRYIGCSNLPAWQLMKALAVSREQRLERFRARSRTTRWSGRELEREMIPLLKDQGLGLLVWSPLAGGFLSGKFTRDGGDEAARRAKFDFPPVNKEKGFAILDVLTPIAGRTASRVPQIALAWILANDAVTSVIIGAKKARAARRQPEGGRRHADGGRPEGARRGQQADAGVSGVDGRARIGSPAGRAAILKTANANAEAPQSTQSNKKLCELRELCVQRRNSDRSSCAGCSARTPVKCFDLLAARRAGATSTASAAIARAAGSSLRSPIARDTS